MADETKLAVIAKFNQHGRAETARIVLEDEEIECWLMDENQAGFPVAGAIPVRVAVREEDGARAREVLQKANLI